MAHFINEDQYDLFIENISLDNINDTSDENGPTLIEIVVNENKPQFLEFMLKKVFDLSKHKLTSVHEYITNILNVRDDYLNNEFNAGYNRLHVAVMDGEPEMIDYILKHGLIDANSTGVPIGTPLHLAILLGRIDCIQILIQYNVDVDIPNKHEQTALQMVIEYGLATAVPNLFSLSKDINNCKYMGIGILQIAVIKDWQDLATILVNAGADMLSEIKSSDENILETISRYCDIKPSLLLSSAENSLTLCLKLHQNIYPCFMELLSWENINVTDGNGNTLLHLAATLQNSELCESIIGIGAVVDLLNNFGNNPFQEMILNLCYFKSFTKKQVAVGTLLLKHGMTLDGNDILKATAINCEKFYLLVIQHTTLFDFQIIDFEAIVKRRWFKAANQLFELMPDNFIYQKIDSDIAAFFIKYADFEEISKFTNHLLNAVSNFSFNNAEDKSLTNNLNIEALNTIWPCILNEAVNRDNISLFKSLLERPIEKPEFLCNGETVLTNLIKNNKSSLISMLLHSKTREIFVNMANKVGQTPLDLAIITKDISLIDTFVLECNELNKVDNNGNTPLGLFFKTFNDTNDLEVVERIAKTMINSGASPFCKDGNNTLSINHCCDEAVKSRIISFAEKRISGLKSNKNDMECKVCLSEPVTCTLECGHVYCSQCAARCTICPTCRMPRRSIKKIYF